MRVDMSGVGAGPHDDGRSGLRQLAERFAAMARRGRFAEEASERFEPTLARLLTLLDPPFPELPDALATSLALGLAAAVRALPGELPSLSFACLACAGPFGQALAATCVREGVLPREVSASALQPLSPAVGLGLANHLFLEAGAVHGRAVDWAFMMLDRAAPTGRRELGPFLAAYAGRVPGLAHPVKEALWSGGVGEEIRRMNPARASLEDLREALAWLKLLRPVAEGLKMAPVLAVQGNADLACRFLELMPGEEGQGKTLSRAIASAKGSQAARCLEAAMEVAPDKAPAIAAMLAHGSPDALAVLAGVAPLLPPQAHRDFLAGLKPGARAAMCAAELSLIAAEDPAGAALAAESAGSRALAVWLAARPGVAPAAVLAGLDRAPDVAAWSTGAPGGPEKPVQREFSLRQLLGLSPARPRDGGELMAVSEEIPEKGGTVEGRVFHEGAFKAKSLEGVAFSACRFQGTDFSRATLAGVIFRGCSFKRCLFDGASLSGCSFESCVLEGCSFTGALLTRTGLVRSRLSGCGLAGARLSAFSLAESALDGCDLSGIAADRATLIGVRLVGCLLDRARIRGIAVISVETVGVQARQARVWDLAGDEEFFMKLQEKTLRRSLARPDHEASLPPLPQQEAEAVLEAWTARREAMRRLRAHLSENAARLAAGRSLLGPGRAELARLIPVLLHTDVFDQAMGIYPMAPPCRIASYHPTLDDLETARRHFPQADALDEPAEALLIEGVHTIGSFGTLAQTERSDLDIWVLIRPGQAAEADLDGLSSKLSAMERWIHHAYGMEVHFYQMDVERVAANDFGVSHEEGSGSAQAMLLKEEFYRTGVLLAGKPPLWWAAPVRCGEEEYQALARDPEFRATLADLGRIGEIPRDEFFGASLWQIFKSIAAPYKSVMKIGLLERYAAGEGGAGLLCESIKAALLSKRPSPWELDPYARLFAEVHGHYRSKGMRDDAALIRLAFLAKSELVAKAGQAGRPLTPRESQSREMLLGKGGLGTGLKSDGETGPGFKEQHRIGELLGRFIERAYTRLADQADAFGGSAITPEDMTRLGRRIVAAFSRRPHKVEVMPFTRDLACQVVYVAATRGETRGEMNAYSWRIQAGEALPGESRLNMVLSREGRDLGAQLVWLAANGVFGPGTQVSADYTINPVTAKDIQEYLAALAEFFPKEGILMAGTAEALNDEAAAKAFVAVNLTRPREAKEVLELIIAYQTTWGELFVRTVRPRQQPPYDPVKMVQAVSGLECTPDLQIRWFKPARSACPPPFGREGDS